MSSQAKKIALHTTNALQDSIFMKSHKIKKTTNFPAGLIAQLRPSLKNKFIITREKTREQTFHHQNDITSFNLKQNALIIESSDQNTVNEVDDVIRYIHHHTSAFHISISRTISPIPRPSIDIFRKFEEYRSHIYKIADQYNCYIWFFDQLNKFGMFSDNTYNGSACVQDIRNYIHSVAETDLDYIQCNQMHKQMYFSKMNKSFHELRDYCNDKYKSEYDIITKNCDRGFVWIWSKNEECRKYIKNYIENDLKLNWCYKYVSIEHSKVSILFGRPHNENHDKAAAFNGQRYNEFWKIFRWDKEEGCCYFWNKYNKKCKFKYKSVLDTRGNAYYVFVAVNVWNYDSMSDAKAALDDIEYRISLCVNEGIEQIELSVEYQAVLTGCFANDVDYSIRYDGSNRGFKNDILYVKHDNNGKYKEFKSILFDKIVANTIIINGAALCKEYCKIVERLLEKRIGENMLRFVQVVSKNDNEYVLVIYDDKIGNKEYRKYILDIIEDIRCNEIDSMRIDPEYIPIIVGPNGALFGEMLKYCGIELELRSLVQVITEDGMVLFGLNKTDERLIKLKGLIRNVIDNCDVIKVLPKEWNYLAEYKNWNIKLLQNEFPKCSIALCPLTADRFLFYGTDKIKNVLVNRLNSV
eukprot:140299_1